MEREVKNDGHVIHMSWGDDASTSFHDDDDIDDSDESDQSHYDDGPSTRTIAPMLQLSSTPQNASNSWNVSLIRGGDNYARPPQRSPLNSGFWISIELVLNVGQIIAAISVLCLSRNEHPQSPLYAWIIGYAVGCVLTLPYLWWRYIQYENSFLRHEPEHSHHSPSQVNLRESTSYTTLVFPEAMEELDLSSAAVLQYRQNSAIFCSRFNAFADHFKIALNCFFGVWFVVGNVWIFGEQSSEYSAPNLYRLCIVFLAFSCIGYTIPFILFATVCCCYPCIISILGFRGDFHPSRGASSVVINSLPTYKFKSKRRVDSGSNSKFLCETGILTYGIEKEQMTSAEDAGCCICLAKYVDDDKLRELPCAHFFHKECVDKWLKINALCPLCKSEVGNSSSTLFAYLSSSIRRFGSVNSSGVSL
ncbi:hypothetical protein Cni_G29233 [Canna indica]|uniref:RING-type domain-containing protein n=1 Tax=Canna indica TaxID=4628 RepID=A0AAQ3QTB9_9LILI|nr:hypothetical protein Cni_G29233 [Canna indica]